MNSRNYGNQNYGFRQQHQTNIQPPKELGQPQAQNTPQQPFGAPVNYPFFGVQPPTQQNTSQQSHLTAGPPPTAQNAQHPGNFNRNKRGQNKPNWPNRNQNQNQNQRNNNNNQSSGHFGNQQSSSQGNNQERAFVPHKNRNDNPSNWKNQRQQNFPRQDINATQTPAIAPPPPQKNDPPTLTPATAATLSKEEIEFDEQFRKWEEEFTNWKQANINHPDKVAYKQYEDQFEQVREKLLLRRNEMLKKKLEQQLIVNPPKTVEQLKFESQWQALPTPSTSQQIPYSDDATSSSAAATLPEVDNQQNYNEDFFEDAQFNRFDAAQGQRSQPDFSLIFNSSQIGSQSLGMDQPPPTSLNLVTNSQSSIPGLDIVHKITQQSRPLPPQDDVIILDENENNFQPQRQREPVVPRQQSYSNAQHQRQTRPKIDICDLLDSPGRGWRDANILIMIRGAPGSGKSYLANLIKEQEAQYGNKNVSTLSIDSNLSDNPNPHAIGTYMDNLVSRFRSIVEQHQSHFITIEIEGSSLKYFNMFYNIATTIGNFKCYVIEIHQNFEFCNKNNLHGRSEQEIKKIIEELNHIPSPMKTPILDPKSLLMKSSSLLNISTPTERMESSEPFSRFSTPEATNMHNITSNIAQLLKDQNVLNLVQSQLKPTQEPSMLAQAIPSQRFNQKKNSEEIDNTFDGPPSGSNFDSNSRQGNSSFDPNVRQGNSGIDPNNRQANSSFDPNNRQGNSGFDPNNRQGNSSFDPNGRQGNSNFDPNGRQGNSGFDPNVRQANSSFVPNNRQDNSSFDPNNRQGNANFDPNGRQGNSSFDPNNRQGTPNFQSQEDMGNENSNFNSNQPPQNEPSFDNCPTFTPAKIIDYKHVHMPTLSEQLLEFRVFKVVDYKHQTTLRLAEYIKEIDTDKIIEKRKAVALRKKTLEYLKNAEKPEDTVSNPRYPKNWEGIPPDPDTRRTGLGTKRSKRSKTITGEVKYKDKIRRFRIRLDYEKKSCGWMTQGYAVSGDLDLEQISSDDEMDIDAHPKAEAKKSATTTTLASEIQRPTWSCVQKIDPYAAPMITTIPNFNPFNHTKISDMDKLLWPVKGIKSGRPNWMLIVIRGAPGSGKSHLSGLIRRKEKEHGNEDVRIISIHDFFEANDGYDPQTFAVYSKQVVLRVEKTMKDRHYNMIVVDAENIDSGIYENICQAGKTNSFVVYTIELHQKLDYCIDQNINHRSVDDIKQAIEMLNKNRPPLDHMLLNPTVLYVVYKCLINPMIKDDEIPKQDPEPVVLKIDDDSSLESLDSFGSAAPPGTEDYLLGESSTIAEVSAKDKISSIWEDVEDLVEPEDAPISPAHKVATTKPVQNKRIKPPAKLPEFNWHNREINDLRTILGEGDRPERILVVLRGAPGSGKSYLAQIIQRKEKSNGNSEQFKIFSYDDLVDECSTADDFNMDKLVNKLEDTMNGSAFNFIVIDADCCDLQNYNKIYDVAKFYNFSCYTIELMLDDELCKENEDAVKKNKMLQEMPTPNEHVLLDPEYLYAEFENMLDDENNLEGFESDEDVETSFGPLKNTPTKSKWDNDADEGSTMIERLDGTRNKNFERLTMENYLQTDEEWTMRPSTSGKKRVRWADIEEKKEQERMREIGFIVGVTDWKRMTDTSDGKSALEKTKYIESRKK